MQTRTQVGIVGAGPAGLLLGHLLHLAGIDSVIVEARSRDYVIDRVRAGVLEQGTVDLMIEAGLGHRLCREGMRHGGVFLSFERNRHHVDFEELTGGRAITIYGQNEVVKDLIGARHATGRPLHFEAQNVAVRDLDTVHPRIHFVHAERNHELVCDFIAGCDGFHGVCRPAIPSASLRLYERTYPFAWLGILAEAAPSCDELVYAISERGFALFSMRSHAITRLYLQCSPAEDLASWPDDRIWDELDARLGSDDGWRPNRGEVLQKGITGMRSFVAEPMQYGRLFLAGDSAHVVPPAGAKGLNLAVSDVRTLASALQHYYSTGSDDKIASYSANCLRRVWKAQRFSSWMTSLLHRIPGDAGFEFRRQLAELDYLFSSRAALTSFAENYTGLSIESS